MSDGRRRGRAVVAALVLAAAAVGGFLLLRPTDDAAVEPSADGQEAGEEGTDDASDPEADDPSEPSTDPPEDEAGDDAPELDLPTFVDTEQLQRCALAAAEELAAFPETTDDLVPSTAAQVSELRDLPIEDPIDATFLDGDELADRVADEVLEQYTEEQADTDRRLLAALGVVAPDTDLRALLVGLQEDQVAGFYDPTTAELVVLQSGEGEASPTDRITLAHEIQHALADQRFDLELGELPGAADAEQARLAVIEGDATLSMTLWSTRGLSIAEQLGLATSDVAVGAAQDLEAVPRYLVGSLLFPYEAGLNLVCAAYLDGGWPAVDALYADPPETTAQVLDLRLWRDDVQPEVPAPSTPPADDWTPALEETFGRLDLQLLFEAPADQRDRALADPTAAAARWRGGRVVVWRPPTGTTDVVDVSLVGDGLCEPVAAWLDATWETTAFTEAASATPAAVEVTAPLPDREASLRCDADAVDVRLGPQTGADQP